MVVNDFMTILGTVQQTMSARLVDKPDGITGKSVDFINRTIGRDISVGSCILQMPFYIFT